MRLVSWWSLTVFMIACGGGDAPPSGQAGSSTPAADLTPEQIERGIGPVQHLVLSPVDHELAERGEESFEMKCMSCHRIDERYVGPALGGVTERRTPEFIMNMILNPQEMSQRHPVVRALVAEFMLVMPQQNLDQAEARAILEYLRTTSQ